MVTVGVRGDDGVKCELLLEIPEPVIQIPLHVVAPASVFGLDPLSGAGLGSGENAAITLAHVEEDHLEQTLLLIICLLDGEGIPTLLHLRPGLVDVVADPEPITPEELLLFGLQVARIVEVDHGALSIEDAVANSQG